MIGASTAYYLSKRLTGSSGQVTVVERTGIACASSGKAGAFLALDWCAGSALDPLARRSFALHAVLPKEIGGDWGYHQLTTYSGYAVTGRGARLAGSQGRQQPNLDWLAPAVVLGSRIGSTETTASIHPGAFTNALMQAAQANGARLRYGEVRGIERGPDGASVTGVLVDDDRVEADAVVVAMGPWSILASGWLPLPGIFAYKGHSLIFETGSTVSPDALFLEVQAGGATVSPEVFPRADGTTYVAMSSSQDALPLDPADVMPDPRATAELEAICAAISPALSPEQIVTRQACYRPVTRDGLPLIGQVPNIAGAYVATGHSVWGVLNGPATGEALAELIVDGAAASTDLRPFDPGRLRPLDPRSLR